MEDNEEWAGGQQGSEAEAWTPAFAGVTTGKGTDPLTR